MPLDSRDWTFAAGHAPLPNAAVDNRVSFRCLLELSWSVSFAIRMTYGRTSVLPYSSPFLLSRW
jgi:hypothetical protein